MIKGAVAVISALFIYAATTAFADEPLKIVETRVDRIVKILGDKGLEEDVKVKELEKAADETFDYVYLSRMTLGRNWLKLDDGQRREFVDLYRRLLEKNYMGQLLAYTDEKVVFDRQTMLSDTKAEVDSKVVSSDKKIPITYRLIRKDGDWKVYDLVIEGISLVSNYRTQFNDILSRQTPAEMLAILRKKVTDKSG
ncbi:MAG: ABC transporter substrate-binding protein [Desulfobacterales bacterium]|jgi:phospholipid transport system substrate-binding protein